MDRQRRRRFGGGKVGRGRSMMERDGLTLGQAPEALRDGAGHLLSDRSEEGDLQGERSSVLRRSLTWKRQRLLVQCEDLAIPVCSSMPALDSFDVVLDAIFGFGFSGVVRAPFDSIVSALKRSQTPLLSIDVPTGECSAVSSAIAERLSCAGWHVEQGNVDAQGLEPQVLISLTAPKLCAKTFSGRHYLGGRFVPPYLPFLHLCVQ